MKNLNKLFLVLLTVLFTSGVIFAQNAQKCKGVAKDVQSQTITKSEAFSQVTRATNTEIDFEDEVEFTFDFDPWTTADVDGLATYGFTGIDFPHSYEAMAYIVFNPLGTTPPMTDDPEIQPHSGEQFGACMASVPSGSAGNDDWFISPQLTLEDGAAFTFWAKSYTAQYGLEKFNVAVSTTTNDPDDFTVISGGTPVAAPVAWTEYSYDLSAYAGEDVYIAIQCVSFDAFVFMIDDLVVTGAIGPQTVLYEDDFESYTTGGYIAEQNPEWWDTWSGTVGGGEDGMISEDVAMSGSKSVLVDETGGATDLLMLLGDKVSGAFDVNFYMYIPDGYCGYYNFQHMEAPGVEWAFEMYFHTDRSCKFLIAGETLEDYTYSHDTWIYFEHKIDLDNDHAELYIDGVFYKDWQWSLQAQGAQGANQLGGIDFFAGGEGTDSPKYYFDDVKYIQTAFQTDPVITLDPISFEQTLDQGQTATQTLNIGNIGATDLDYELAIVYDLNSDRTPITPSVISSNNHILGLSCSADPTGNSQSPATTDDEVTLNYDGDNSSAIGWTVAPTDAEVAAMFPTSMTGPHAGMQLTSVFVFINDLGENFKLKVYGMGTDIAPGSLLVEQDFSPAAASWHIIELDEPLTITGEDLWVGYSFTQQAEDLFVPGCDAGPNDPNGDWLKTGVGWGHLSSNPDLPYNWNIRANLTGEAITHWLTVDPATGMVVPSGSQDVDVNFDATGVEAGTHNADIVVFSNDPENSIAYIPVSFTVNTSGAEQTITIDPGFQFVSSNVDPENPDMMEVAAEIINDDLMYIRNSIGAMLRKIGPNWVNGIGDWIGTEGYLIKTSAMGEFTVAGTLIDPGTPISLIAGFQFVSYLPEAEMDALEAFATIIGDDLIYIRNSVGAMLRKIGPNWVNGIGNCFPTEGYLIKMAADAELVYPTDGAPASVTSVEKGESYFNFEGGDPSAPLWTIYIGGADLTILDYDLEAGDEIAVFDGDLLVGVIILHQVCTVDNQFENFIVAFTELVSGPGYVVSNPFTFVAWDQSDGIESTGFGYEFTDPYGDAYVGDVFPEETAASPYSIATFTFTAVGIDENAINVAIYPNPVTDILNINSNSKVSSVRVLNYLGQTIDNIDVTGMEVTINTSTYDTGIYFIQIETEKGISTQKIIIE